MKVNRCKLPESFTRIKPTQESNQHPSLTGNVNHIKSATDEADAWVASLGKESEEKTWMYFLIFYYDQSVSNQNW